MKTFLINFMLKYLMPAIEKEVERVVCNALKQLRKEIQSISIKGEDEK